MAPAGTPVVSRVAVLPVPETVPPDAVQPLTVTGTLSGLVHVQERFEEVPACTVVGFAVQDIVGAFFGGSFTVKFAVQLASPPLFILGSLMCAVTV
jgi:hypothetical protein